MTQLPSFASAIVSPALPGSLFFSGEAFAQCASTARMEYEAVVQFRIDGDELELRATLGDLDWSDAAIAAIVADPFGDHFSGLYDPPEGYLLGA